MTTQERGEVRASAVDLDVLRVLVEVIETGGRGGIGGPAPTVPYVDT